MIFALDVGNTNIVLGVFGSDYKMPHSWRITQINNKTEDETLRYYSNLLH